MAHDVVLIPGDGIGPEITQAMRRVVEATWATPSCTCIALVIYIEICLLSNVIPSR